MKRVAGSFRTSLALVLAACGGAATAPLLAPSDPGPRAALADDEHYAPPYGKPELSRALIGERGAEATGERVVGELEANEARDAAADERLRVAMADLGVRRRFIASLETCESGGRWCPPRLDDPPWAFDPSLEPPRDPQLETPLRFDLASWQKVAAELHGRACACRTLACVDSVGVAIDHLEGRPIPDVQGDDAATLSITRARECLFRLRGRPHRARAPRPE